MRCGAAMTFTSISSVLPPSASCAASGRLPPSGASVALYVFAYACYFFVFRTEMTGALQAAFYFGYSGLACCGLALMTGTVGTVSAAAFVRAIYSSIKGD